MTDRFASLRAWKILAAVGGLACGTSVPEPAAAVRGQPPYQEVPTAPPPALLEIVPPIPSEDAVWVDGAWTHDGIHWIFRRGGWAVLPAGYERLPSSLVVLKNGRILYAPPSWVDEAGRPVPPPSLLRAASSPPEPQVTAKPVD